MQHSSSSEEDSVALGIFGEKLSYLPPDTGDKQYFKILSALAGVSASGEMPLQAVTNSLSGRFSRGSPVFIISSCEGDGTVPAAVRDLVGRGHEVTVLSPSSIDFERLVSRIPRMSYEVLKLERQNRLTTLAGSGAQVIDWMPDMDLSQALMQVRGVRVADDVQVQGDVTITGSARARTLHLKNLRKQWQIITLQVIATAALVGMYLEVVSTYVVGTIDHTILFSSIETLIGDQLPIADWLTGEGRSGLSRFFVPLIIGLGIGGIMALIAYQTPKTQQRIKVVFIVSLITILVGRLLLSWLSGMLFSFDLRLPNSSEVNTLEWPLLLIMSLLIMFVYLLPIIMGARGIWGYQSDLLHGQLALHCYF